MNTNVFREFAEKLKPWTCPAHGHFIETTAKRTFSSAYDLLEEAQRVMEPGAYSTVSVKDLAQLNDLSERITDLLRQKGNNLESDKPLPQGMSLVPMAKAIRELAKKGANRAVVDLDKYDLILKTNQSLPCADSVISTPQVAEEKWISVEDRAPEPRDQWLLCCGDGGEMCTIAWWKQPDGSYKFQHLNACEYPNLSASHVKFWMRLPESPSCTIPTHQTKDEGVK